MPGRVRAVLVATAAVLLTATLLPAGAAIADDTPQAEETAPAAPAAPAGEAATETTGSSPGDASCTNRLALTLSRAGFTGTDLREAWAIAMRESRGISVGPGHPQFNGRDYGIFQFNRPTFGGQSWWRPRKLLNPDYSAAMAFRLSKGGTDWVLWGMDGDGRPRPELYEDFGWTPAQVRAWIIRPYERFYRAFPC